MKQFPSIQKLDTGILYTLELTSSISVLLLAFGLISSMVNVLTKGSILSNSPFMQQVYAWTQCIGIDASIPGSIMRTLAYLREREWVKTGLYTLLSALLLFTACIVSNIESTQQTLNIPLESAYTHVFVPIEALIWIRSIAVVLLVVVHAIKHVQAAEERREQQNIVGGKQAEQTTNGLSVQVAVQNHTILVEQPPARKQQVTVQEVLVEPKGTAQAGKVEQKPLLPEPTQAQSHQQRQAEENREQVRAYRALHPDAKATEVAMALSLSLPTVRKYMREVA